MMKKMMAIDLLSIRAVRLVIKNRASAENFSMRPGTQQKLFLMMIDYISTPEICPEMFSIKERDDVEFDEFEGSGKCVEKFRKSFLSFHGHLKD